MDELIALLVKYKVTTTKDKAKKLADEIVKEREKQKFTKPEDIMKTKGIDEKAFNKIKEAISV